MKYVSPPLVSVTITGADDAVSPSQLVTLSNRFPFVEWGVLFSEKRTGTPRYPSIGWIEAVSISGVSLSAHLCGFVAKEAGEGRIRAPLVSRFGRIQINGYGPSMLSGICRLAVSLRAEFVLQCKSPEGLQRTAHDASVLARGSVLFDPSGGEGLAPFAWPAAPSGCRIGFTGGIGPGTVETTVAEIVVANPLLGPFWIDMESGVRTDNRFDLGLVTEVLGLVERINARAA